MKNVGVITIIDYRNYGNRFQAYAVQRILKGLNFSAEAIICKHYTGNQIIRFIRRFNKPLPYLLKKLLSKLNSNANYMRDNSKNTMGPIETELNKKKVFDAKREETFREFSRKHITEKTNGITKRKIPANFGNRYDFFLVGSDQVWNLYFGVKEPFNFISVAPIEKRIAYSASFGISAIPDEYKRVYRKGLQRMAHISVREETGAKIVKELTGRYVPVLVDPAMMLTAEQWREIAAPAKLKPERPYLLTYFLGDITQVYREKIDGIIKYGSFDVVNLNDLDDEQRYTIGPDEFLDYVDHADVIMTDSFHGAVLSVVFKKPFVVFDRISNMQSMNSRLDTLLKKFRLENRKAESITRVEDVFTIDYSHVQSILEAERNKALDYLKNALNVKEVGII